MSGYVYMLGPCLVCKRPFSYNPVRVPSHPARGGVPVADASAPKEPICSECIVVVNAGRREAGNAEWPVHPDAYEPVAEGELP
jgi:hypothetical protein